MQQDVDYLYKYRDYLELDDLLQSQFTYLSNVLVSYYRVNRHLASPAIEKYLGVEYEECQRFQDHEQDKMYQCVASEILDRVLEYYGKRYKFNTEADIATITGKLEREPYAINDFILLSYNLARSYFYFPMNLLDDKDKLRIGNKYIDFILSNEHLYPQSFKSFIFYLSKKYQKIFEYDENIIPLKQLETRLKNEFDLITEKDLVSVINKINSVPQYIRKLEEILLAVKPEIALRYGTLQNIVATLDTMINDNNEYINSYRPWKNYDQDPTSDIVIPKNSIFTVGVLKFEMILVRASMASCNAVIHYKDPIKLVRANEPILLESLKDLEKFILMDGMQGSWSDIGVKYVRRRTAQSLSILQESIHMESSDNDILSQKLEAIANKISDNRFDDTIIADVRNLIISLSGN